MSEGLQERIPFFEAWFCQFNNGLQQMSEEECGRLFQSCARHCAKSAFEELYAKLFKECGGDLDVFFSRLHEVPAVDGSVVEKGHVYQLVFTRCTCDLHTHAQVNSPRLCECSRQSIVGVIRMLVPQKSVTVRRGKTILDGAACCRFQITVA